MGGMRLTKYLWYVYGPLEGRTAYYTVYFTDRKPSDNRHRQIALDCPRLPQIAYVTVQVENGGKLRWNLVDSRDLPNSAIFCQGSQINQSRFSIPGMENRHWLA